MESEGKGDKTLSPKLWIVGGIVVVPFLLVGGLFFVWFVQNQTKVLSFEEIPQTQTETEAIGRKLIHGELVGSIVSETSFAGRVVAVCTTEKARVLKKGGKILLECPNKGVKTAPINQDNTFGIRLLPDTYIVTVSLENNEQSIQIPTKVMISGDTKTKLPIVVTKK